MQSLITERILPISGILISINVSDILNCSLDLDSQSEEINVNNKSNIFAEEIKNNWKYVLPFLILLLKVIIFAIV